MMRFQWENRGKEEKYSPSPKDILAGGCMDKGLMKTANEAMSGE